MAFATHLLLLTALLATAVAPAAPASGIPKAPLVVTLGLSGDMKNIQADVTNTGADSLDVITLHTPLSTDDQGGYRVSDKTRVLTFQGLIKAYITSNLSEFHQTITPGKTATTLWPLSLFDFTNSTGPYHASTSGIFQYRLTSADMDSDYKLGEYESNDLQFPHAPPSIGTRANDAVLVHTEGCTQSQLDYINAACFDFGQLADAGTYALTGGQDTAFAEFFGKTVDSAEYRTLTSKFFNLRAAKTFANTQEQQPSVFSFSCIDRIGRCRPGVAAYVKGPDANVVTFCPAFFTSRVIALSYLCSTPTYQPSNDGYLYRGGILLREFLQLGYVMKSHPFKDETNNNGHKAYGYAASKLLATQNPGKASRNPDNYGYFAEVEYARGRGGACSGSEL